MNTIFCYPNYQVEVRPHTDKQFDKVNYFFNQFVAHLNETLDSHYKTYSKHKADAYNEWIRYGLVSASVCTSNTQLFTLAGFLKNPDGSDDFVYITPVKVYRVSVSDLAEYRGKL